MPTPPATEPAPEYVYDLDLMLLDTETARFVYISAPAPHDDDTALDLNREVWESMGRPARLRVTIDVRETLSR